MAAQKNIKNCRKRVERYFSCQPSLNKAVIIDRILCHSKIKTDMPARNQKTSQVISILG